VRRTPEIFTEGHEHIREKRKKKNGTMRPVTMPMSFSGTQTDEGEVKKARKRRALFSFPGVVTRTDEKKDPETGSEIPGCREKTSYLLSVDAIVTGMKIAAFVFRRKDRGRRNRSRISQGRKTKHGVCDAAASKRDVGAKRKKTERGRGADGLRPLPADQRVKKTPKRQRYALAGEGPPKHGDPNKGRSAKQEEAGLTRKHGGVDSSSAEPTRDRSLDERKGRTTTLTGERRQTARFT